MIEHLEAFYYLSAFQTGEVEKLLSGTFASLQMNLMASAKLKIQIRSEVRGATIGKPGKTLIIMSRFAGYRIKTFSYKWPSITFGLRSCLIEIQMAPLHYQYIHIL